MSESARMGAGAVAACVAAAFAPSAAAAAAPPNVTQLIVYRNGTADQGPVTAARTTAPVGHKRCAVGAGTPLAALLHSSVSIELKDYGSCSRHPADAGGLYVSQIGTDRARGANGWVYKVGQRVAPAGAADYSGPFGNGRLKQGARVTWFYCRMKAKGCQRTLVAKPKALGGGQVRVTVRAYDDRGKARPAAGATVHFGSETVTADAQGVAVSTVATATVDTYAESNGTVRSFTERVNVR